MHLAAFHVHRERDVPLRPCGDALPGDIVLQPVGNDDQKPDLGMETVWISLSVYTNNRLNRAIPVGRVRRRARSER